MIPDIKITFPQEETRIATPTLSPLLSMIQLYHIPGASLAVIQEQTIMTFDWGVKKKLLSKPGHFVDSV